MTLSSIRDKKRNSWSIVEILSVSDSIITIVERFSSPGITTGSPGVWHPVFQPYSEKHLSYEDISPIIIKVPEKRIKIEPISIRSGNRLELIDRLFLHINRSKINKSGVEILGSVYTSYIQPTIINKERFVANLDSVSIHSLLNTERADAVEIKNPKKTQRKDATTVKISNKSTNRQSIKVFIPEQLIKDIEEINLLEWIK